MAGIVNPLRYIVSHTKGKIEREKGEPLLAPPETKSIREVRTIYGSLSASPGIVFTMSLKITITANNTRNTNAAW